MTEFREDPSERPADAGGSSKSAPNPDRAGSHETGSDPETIAEQSIPITSTLLPMGPPQRERLARVLSDVCKDPVEVDAVIEEIKGLSGERLYLYIKSLEIVVATRLDAQGQRLDAHGEQLRDHSEQLREHGARIEKNTEALGTLRAEIHAQRVELKAQGTATQAQIRALTKEIQSLRNENRFMLGVFALVIALGVFGWLGDGCSRPVDSDVGVEASQTVGGRSGDGLGSTEATREASGESVETDETAEAGGERSASAPEASGSAPAAAVSGGRHRVDQTPEDLAE